MTKQDALKLLDEYISSPSLKIHCLCVGSSMRIYAKKYGVNEDLWELGGILHDLDWEKHPDVHPDECVKLLRSLGENEEMIHAIIAHRDTQFIASDFDKALFACDELSGFVFACVLVRPTKKIDGMEVKSVKKKIKDKAFAKNVSREDILKGAELLGIPLEEHIQNVIDALTANREMLGI
jgi:putative nucleotidyltransferase with HDIG domain